MVEKHNNQGPVKQAQNKLFPVFFDDKPVFCIEFIINNIKINDRINPGIKGFFAPFFQAYLKKKPVVDDFPGLQGP